MKTQTGELWFYPWGGWAWLPVLQHCRSCTNNTRYQPATGCRVRISLTVSSRGARYPRTSPRRRTPPAAWTATGRWRAGSWALRGWRRGWAVCRPPPAVRWQSPWRSWSPGVEWGSPRLGAGRWSGRSPVAGGGAGVRTGSAALSETWTRSGHWSCRALGFLRCERGF